MKWEPMKRGELLLLGMYRRGDHETSIDAAKAIQKKASQCHEMIFHAFIENGPMIDDELDQLPQFRSYAPTSISKRRTEMYQYGRVEAVGTKINTRNRTAILWDLVRKNEPDDDNFSIPL